MSPLRRRIVTIVVIVIVVAVAVTAGLLYLYTSTPLAKVTIEGGQVTIEQGMIPGRGVGDIGTSPQQFGSADGFPLTLTEGSTFTIQVPLDNQDNRSHSLDAVTVLSPFAYRSTTPEVPLEILAGQDSVLQIVLVAPSTAGSYSFDVTLVSLS